LGPDILLVHGASLDDEELDLIHAAGTAISTTPETELQMAMGHPVAVRALARGIGVGLGVDIVSNYSGDLFAQMRLLLQAQRGLENETLDGPPRTIRMKTREVLEMGTVTGATAIGMGEQIGSLTPGRQADLILTSMRAINMVPTHDVAGALVLNANPSNIDTVMVAGEVLKRDGKLVDVDWPSLADKLEESAARIHDGFLKAPVDQIEAIAAAFML